MQRHCFVMCALWAAVALILALPGIVLRAQQRFAVIAVLQTATTIALWLSLLMLAHLWPADH